MAKRGQEGGAVRRSAAQGAALVEQWTRSGLSVSEYCRSRGEREHVLRYWLSRERTPRRPAATQGDFVVVSAPAQPPVGGAVNDGNRAGAVIVMLPSVTPSELVQTLRGLLEEARA